MPDIYIYIDVYIYMYIYIYKRSLFRGADDFPATFDDYEASPLLTTMYLDNIV